MSSVHHTAQAERDLIGIWISLARSDVNSADKTLDRIEAAARDLARHPEMGRRRSELAPLLRSFAVRPFVIFYRPNDGILIVRVLHGARDLPPLFE